jgi:hypothetical protein
MNICDAKQRAATGCVRMVDFQRRVRFSTLPFATSVPERGEFFMRMFSFYIHDSRYSVPTLQIVPAEDEQRARQLAQERLDEAMAHLAVEVVEDDQRLFELRRA